MSISEKLKTLINEIDKKIDSDFIYSIEKLEEHQKALFEYAKFKIGEVVVLATTPEINNKVNFGWLGHKDILTRGQRLTVEKIDYYKGSFRYEVVFKDVGFVATFCFRESELTKPLVEKKEVNLELRDKIINIILQVAMKHHDDISEQDEFAAYNAADEIISFLDLNQNSCIQLPEQLGDDDLFDSEEVDMVTLKHAIEKIRKNQNLILQCLYKMSK